MGNCHSRKPKGKKTPTERLPTPDIRDPAKEQRIQRLFKQKATKVPELHLELSALYQRRKTSPSSLCSKSTFSF